MNISKILNWRIQQRLLNIPILPMQQTKQVFVYIAAWKTICYIVLYDYMMCVVITVHKALLLIIYTFSIQFWLLTNLENHPLTAKSYVGIQHFFGAFAKLGKATISFRMLVCPSICPHGTTQLPLHQFSWNLISEDL